MLAFDEESHIYTWNDEVVPPVTGIIGEFVHIKVVGFEYYVNTITGDVIHANIIRGAGKFGTIIHKACALIMGNTLEWESVHDKFIPCLIQFEKWLSDFKVEPEEIEMQVYSQTFGYAGTFDLRCKILGEKKALVDFKTTPSYAMAGVQIEAYDRAYIEEHGGEAYDHYVLHLPKDGAPYKFKRVETPGAWKYFLNKLSQKRFTDSLKA